MAVSWDSLGYAIGINAVVCLAVFFGFNYLRRIPFLSDFYQPKRKLSIPFRFRPERLPGTWFTWIRPVFTIKPEKFAACAGYDAMVYVQFLWLSVRLCFWISLVALVMCLPTNLTGGFVDYQLPRQDPSETEASTFATNEEDLVGGALESNGRSSFVVTDFDRTAITNIWGCTQVRPGQPDVNHPQCNRMAAHVTANYIMCFIVMKMVWDHYKDMVKWRIQYLSRMRKGDTAHTVLLRDIPGTPQGTVIGRIHDLPAWADGQGIAKIISVMQNMDSTIGRLIPQSFRVKVERAMKEGIGAVFGKVKDNVSFGGGYQLFRDQNYDVYLTAPDGSAYENAADFHDARSRRDSFFSIESAGTPRSLSTGRKFLTAQSSLPEVGGPSSTSQGGGDPFAEPSGLSGPPPPSHVSGRRNLRNYVSRPAHTDFETWKQAEFALQQGVTVKELVEREFARSLGPGEVRSVSVVKNELKLGKLAHKYQKVKLNIEDLSDSWTSSLRRKMKVKRPTVTVRPRTAAERSRWGPSTVKVDKMEYKIWQLQDLDRQIQAEQVEVEGKETSAAFVTMTSRLMASTASLGMLSYDETLWRTDPAPEPAEVIWGNVSYRGWERNLRSLTVWALFGLLVFFMIPIVGIIQSFVNLESYEAGAAEDVINWILDAPVIGGIIEGILPTLGLRIFLALVPIVLRIVSRFIGGLPSRSDIDFAVGRKYFLFQFLIVFVFVTVIGAMLQGAGGDSDDNAIAQLVDNLREDPAQIPTWLGTSLPQQASFYVMYILTSGITVRGIAFLRLPGAAIYLVLSRLAGTARQKKRTWSQQYMHYGDDVGEHTIIVLLALVFAVVQPFVPLVALAYFCVNYFYATYSLMYVQREAFQTGGLFWPVIFNQIYIGMLVWVISNAALFAVKRFAAGAAAMIPLIVLILLFRVAVNHTFDRPIRVISIHAAADLDRADQKYDWMRDATLEVEEEMKAADWDVEDVVLGPVEKRYVQPTLVRNVAAHQSTLREAVDISQRVNAFNGDVHWANRTFGPLFARFVNIFCQQPGLTSAPYIQVIDEEIMLDRSDSLPSEASPKERGVLNKSMRGHSGPVLTVGNVPQAGL